ncbi:DUF2268 domain-containing protein [Robertmurraya andreesenii]|uniref:Uncharacterized protein YjaZ n=1 Tax=Anoxybacillus andreesenii TaxID=1325932 RepID=A0ABT9UYY0_9BACL|nr:DUF2268 domain-containing putative Zn-dependent protease [Robertmurraya andreesenii]MDQ0153888.1 uncharacterized protein YjaZ [Robertmurraya andreesenii]
MEVEHFGVIRTDEWLEEDFKDPKKICGRISGDASRFYSYLQQFGMYKPNLRSWSCFQQLKKEMVWEQVAQLHEKYQKKWNGPDVDIYIFPISSGSFLMGTSQQKGGVSFKGKLFLFLSPFEDKNELEALFIHEYHHVCRIHKQKKDIKEFSLLDSIVLEGLAEHAVEYYCGSKYKAAWCDSYSEEELKKYWKKLKKETRQIKRENPLHDRILFGRGGYPRLLGYALGYYITKDNSENRNFSRKINFYSTSENFIN